MALQAGLPFSKLLLFATAGYYGSVILLRKENLNLSDLLADINSIFRNSDRFSDDNDLASQVRCLAMEVKQLASSRHITVVNGDGAATSSGIILPAAALGVVGYGYLRWWKGFSLRDLMFVTGKNMAEAVSNMTKHLDGVSDALGRLKRSIAARVERLEEKAEEQSEVAEVIKSDVGEVKGEIVEIGRTLGELNQVICGLEWRLCSSMAKQETMLGRVDYLCRFVDTNNLPKLSSMAKGHDQLMSSNLKALPGATGLAILLQGIEGNDHDLATC